MNATAADCLADNLMPALASTEIYGCESQGNLDHMTVAVAFSLGSTVSQTETCYIKHGN
jgi:hypothetical protein